MMLRDALNTYACKRVMAALTGQDRDVKLGGPAVNSSSCNVMFTGIEMRFEKGARRPMQVDSCFSFCSSVEKKTS